VALGLDWKDDPEYVAALLRHGARVDDGRETAEATGIAAVYFDHSDRVVGSALATLPP